MDRSFEDIQREARAIHSLLGGPDISTMEPKIAGFTRPQPISVPIPYHAQHADREGNDDVRGKEEEVSDRIEAVKTALINELTTNGNGDRARRLVLELQDGRDGGGYCIAAIEVIIDRALALLTAEPEPCEDARALAVKLGAMHRKVMELVPHGEFGPSKLDYQAAESMAIDTQAVEIAAYATQVADKRAEELRALREALEPFADADCEDERYSDEDNPQFLSCEEYGKPRAEWCAVCNAKAALAATEPKP